MQCIKQKSILPWRFLVLALVSAMLLLCTSAAQAQSEQIPLAVRRVVLQAQELLEQSNYTAAAKVLEQQRQLAHHHYLIDFTLGNIYLLSGHKQQAIPYYRAVLQQRPHHGASWLNLAQCLYATAQYEQAAQAFQAGYANPQPDQVAQPQLLYNAALCYLSCNDSQQALTVLTQLVHDFPDNVLASWRGALVQVYLQLDQPLQAIRQLEVLVKQTSAAEQRRWRELLVQQYMALKMTAKAYAAVQHYIEDDGLEPLWWQLLTHLYLEDGRYPQALVALKVLAYLRPLHDEEMKLLADLHLNLGVPAQAIRYYQQLQQQYPHDKKLLTSLAYASLNLHKPQQALYWAQQGAEGSDKNATDSSAINLLRLQAQLLFSLKRYPEAVKMFGRVAALEKGSGAAWLMQGYAAWNGELWQQARQAFKRAERYPKQRQRARELLAQLQTLTTASAAR